MTKPKQVKRQSKPKNSPEDIQLFLGRHFGAKLSLYQKQLMEYLLAHTKEENAKYCKQLQEEIEGKSNG